MFYKQIAIVEFYIMFNISDVLQYIRKFRGVIVIISLLRHKSVFSLHSDNMKIVCIHSFV